MAVTDRSPKVSGLNFNAFSERVSKVTVNYRANGTTFKFDVFYFPGRFNDKYAKRAEEFRARNRNRDDDDDQSYVDFLNETLLDVIEKWDLYDGDPTDESSRRYDPDEIMEKLELNVKAEILNEIQKDSTPGEVKRTR